MGLIPILLHLLMGCTPLDPHLDTLTPTLLHQVDAMFQGNYRYCCFKFNSYEHAPVSASVQMDFTRLPQHLKPLLLTFLHLLILLLSASSPLMTQTYPLRQQVSILRYLWSKETFMLPS